ncbi:TPA: phage holin family protein [Streptococcus suis]
MFSILICLDIISGLVKGVVNKRANSTKGLLGIVKHFLVVLLVYTFYPYLVLLGAKPLAIAFVAFFIGVYGISVVENYGQLGLPMPVFLKNYFEKLRRAGEQGQIGEFTGIRIDSESGQMFFYPKNDKEGQNREEGL